MKLIIDETDTLEDIRKGHEFMQNLKQKEPNQSQLPQDKQEKKYYCNNPDCKKEIEKSVVAYCLHSDNKDRFKGKVLCRECQEGR